MVVAVGPWIPALWEHARARRTASTSAGPTAASTATCRCGPTGTCRRARWRSTPPPSGPPTADASAGPPRRLRPPLRDDDGRLITDEPWGIYVKPDRDSVQGGAAAADRVGHAFEVDPYPTGTVDHGFPDRWCAALSHCMERFEGVRGRYRQVRSGGAGAFTADNFPVFDRMRDNVYVAADSNHGYKMIAVGREIARELQGEHSSLLRPFRLRALRDRRAAPGLAQPLPVELSGADCRAGACVVVGGGVLGLAAARGAGRAGPDVLVLEKDRVGAGASGVAGGIVRNFYRSPAIADLVRDSVEIFESDPSAFGFRQPGYLAVVPERQVADLDAIREHHERGRLRLRARRRRRALRASTSLGLGPTGRRRCAGAAARAPRRLGRRDAHRAPSRRRARARPGPGSRRGWR